MHEPKIYSNPIPLKIQVNRVVEVPCQSIPKPYKINNMDSETKEPFNLYIKIEFHKIDALCASITKLY